MNLAEYASYDALGLAELVAKKEVTPKELALTAVAASDKVEGVINAVAELYRDCIAGLDEASLGSGPFRGVPFLIKDVFGHEKGRKIEFGSRLCEGMTVEAGTAFVDWPESERRRHLLRLWLAAWDARPLPEIFAQRYGSVTIGDRGGVIVRGTRLHAPLQAA